MNIRYPIYEGVYRILTIQEDRAALWGTSAEPDIRHRRAR